MSHFTWGVTLKKMQSILRLKLKLIKILQLTASQNVSHLIFPRDLQVSLCFFRCMFSWCLFQIIPILVLKNGNECFCVEEIPFDKLNLISAENELDFCNVTCIGSNISYCGGIRAFSIYVASNEILVIILCF